MSTEKFLELCEPRVEKIRAAIALIAKTAASQRPEPEFVTLLLEPLQGDLNAVLGPGAGRQPAATDSHETAPAGAVYPEDPVAMARWVDGLSDRMLTALCAAAATVANDRLMEMKDADL